MWKQIPGYENYEVSDEGEVRSTKTLVKLKPWVQKNGYHLVSLWNNGKKKGVLVHRIVAQAFVLNPNGYGEVNHLNEDKADNRAENLEWCTHKHNMNYGTLLQRQSVAHKGQTAWCKGKKCPQLSAAALGKPHPHKGTPRKKREKEISVIFN